MSMMTTKESPILMSSAMVTAIMLGKKEQTRRIIKPQPVQGQDIRIPASGVGCKDVSEGLIYVNSYGFQHHLFPPYGGPGDLLWVRETWMRIADTRPALNPVFKATKDGPVKLPDHQRWKPSIFLKKEDARLWLRIKGCRVERLTDIDSRGVALEGLTSSTVEDFQKLWESLHGAGSWKDNPLVWVYSFTIDTEKSKLEQLV